MDWFFQSPHNLIIADICFILAAWALVRGVRNFRAGYAADDGSLRVVRGIRGGILFAGLTCIGCGLALQVSWPIWFGLVFLAEEILETGIMVLALRSHRD